MNSQSSKPSKESVTAKRRILIGILIVLVLGLIYFFYPMFLPEGPYTIVIEENQGSGNFTETTRVSGKNEKYSQIMHSIAYENRDEEGNPTDTSSNQLDKLDPKDAEFMIWIQYGTTKQTNPPEDAEIYYVWVSDTRQYLSISEESLTDMIRLPQKESDTLYQNLTGDELD
ncbi:MAG: hypothetical protein ACK5NA_03685 [Enterococcus sp.]